MKKLLPLFLFALAIIATSCNKDEIDEPTLSLSETEWTAPKASTEKAITVTTNQTNWHAYSNADWITIDESGNTLTIQTSENISTENRRAEVTVSVGALGKKIIVTQSGSDVTIVTIPDKIEINQWGGVFQFKVDANTKQWTATSDADWIKITPMQFDNSVQIEIAENKERQERSTKIILSGANKKSVKEFEVVQQGILYYIFPLLEPEVSPKAVRQFEENRRSDLRIDLGHVMGTGDTYDTQSEIFPIINYTFSFGKLIKAEILSISNEIVTNNEFEKVLADNDFELATESDDGNLYKKVVKQGEQSFTIEAQVMLGGVSGVTFTFVPKQKGKFPTFNSFPYGFIEFESSPEEVKVWEKENKGTLNEDQSNEDDGFLAFDATSPWVLRAYIFDDEELEITMGLFPNIQSCYFTYNEQYFFTDEFKELMKKEGFTEFLGEGSQGHKLYKNTKKPLQMGIKISTYNGINNKKPVVEMIFNYSDNESESNLTALNRKTERFYKANYLSK